LLLILRNFYYIFIFVYFYAGESIISDSYLAQQKPDKITHHKQCIEFYPNTHVAYTGNIGRVKGTSVHARDPVKDSGIDTCLSSSCQTLSEEGLKSKVYFI